MPEVLVSHSPDGSKRQLLFPVLERMLSSDPDAHHLVSVASYPFQRNVIKLTDNRGALTTSAKVYY